jgi:hypothetical protein
MKRRTEYIDVNAEGAVHYLLAAHSFIRAREADLKIAVSIAAPVRLVSFFDQGELLKQCR